MHSRENEQLRKMLKFAVIAVSIVFLASTCNGTSRLFYSYARDNADNRITKDIASLEKALEETNKTINDSIAKDLKPLVEGIARMRIDAIKANVTSLNTKPPCNTQATTANTTLEALVAGKLFPELQTCATGKLQALSAQRKNATDKAIEKIKEEKKKIEDGECHNYSKFWFGAKSAKQCCRKVAKAADDILDKSLPDIKLSDIAVKLNESVDDCKKTDTVYVAFEKAITDAYNPFIECWKMN